MTLDPDAPVPSTDLYWAWLREGWKYRLRHNPRLRTHKKIYSDRVQYESGVILEKDFQDYFLVVSDLVRFAKDQGIAVGPGRGSAAASLVCYLLRITEIDPLQFQYMMFERFLSPTRGDFPDIDLDFDDERRHEVQEYAKAKYGADCVGSVANYMRFRGKTAVKDVARVYNIPKWAQDTVTNLIIDRTAGDPRQNDSVHDTFDLFPAAATILERFPNLKYAADLEGDYRGMGKHAAGVVISTRPLTETCALYTRELDDGTSVANISTDKDSSGHLNLLKIDLLGLTTMGMLSRSLNIIGMSLDELYRVPLDDAVTIQAFRDMDLTGIFQFDGRTQRGVTRDVDPEHFEQLVHISGLARPGPLFSGAEELYVARRHGRAPVRPIHPIVDELTTHTYGTIVFQEQVFRIIADLGGFPSTKIDEIRKIISLKLGEGVFNAMLEEFLQGAKDLHGVEHALAQSIWDSMVTAAKYLFNYAHCVCYSMIAFWCQWIKQHHQLAFFPGWLAKTNKDKAPRLLQDVAKHGILLMPPDPERSLLTWSPEKDNELLHPEVKGALRAGFTQVSGIGSAIGSRMIEHRDADPVRPFAWDGFRAVKGVGPKTIEKIKSFVEMDDPFELERVHKILNEFRMGIKYGEKDYIGLPVATHTSDTMPQTGEHYVTWMGFVKDIKYNNEIERIRSRSETEELAKRTDAQILAEMRDPHLLDYAVLTCYDEGEEEVRVRFHRWAFPAWREHIKAIVLNDDVIIASGKKREGGAFGVSIFANSLEVLEQDHEEEEPDPDTD